MQYTKQNPFAAGTVVLAIVLVITLWVTPFPSEAQENTETANEVHVESQYVTMRDGVEIAIDVYFPANYEEGQQYPTLMRTTRYWRAIQNLPISDVAEDVIPLTEYDYVVVRVDARGSGVSGGDRPIEWSRDEIADYGEVADWIAAQPWSNGRVGTYGVSYDGNTAELAAVPNSSAIKAVAPQYSDFDPLIHLAMPGGVFNREFIQLWSDLISAMDVNDICGVAGVEGVECLMTRLSVPGVKYVDVDPQGEQAREFIEQHSNLNVFDALSMINFRDDGMGANGETLESISPYGLQAEIEASNVPMYVWVSWLDAATIDGALSRYLTFSNAQQVIIGPWSHGGAFHVDPFLPVDTPTEPSSPEQLQMLIEWFDQYLKQDPTAIPESSIRYYTLNSGEWRTTEVWPPEGVSAQTWYFGEDGLLTPDAPTADSATDEYTVDFTTTTGTTNRWATQLGGNDVVYPDRAEEDEKLLTYTTAPMESDVEITGSPMLTLYVSSTTTDGAFFAYLEDVAPDGTVTYITEGMLRAIHRKVSGEEPPYAQLGPYHSFLQADTLPLVPGEVAEITFNLFATSVLIEKGHSIRIALAGHDAGYFQRYPEDETPVWAVERNNLYPSAITLPILERNP